MIQSNGSGSDSPNHETPPGWLSLLIATCSSNVWKWALALSIVAAALVAVMEIATLGRAIQPIDDWFWDLAVSAERTPIVDFAKMLNFLGGTLVMAVAIVLVGVVLTWKRQWIGLTVWFTAMSLSQLLSFALKTAVDRPRPPLPLVETSGSSFPSGHSLTAAAVSITLVLVWNLDDRRRRFWLYGAILYALIMAASRVYLRAHWFTDVAAGLAIGAATALWTFIGVSYVTANYWQLRRHEDG